MSNPKPETKLGTLAPSSEQATVLPDFPILWTPLGLCMETVEENLDHQIIVQLVNQYTLPRLNVVTINIQDLIEQEIRASTDLGLRLKAAKQDPNEKKKKEADQQKWIPPSALLLELVNARMSFDGDLEHKKEAAKRKKDLEDARIALEAGSAQLKTARDELLSAESSLKIFKSTFTKAKEEEKPKESNTAKKGISVPLSAKHEKERMEGAISGNLKVAKDKISKPEQNEGVDDDTWQKLVASYNQAKVKCQEMERKDVDTRYYNQLLSEVPTKFLSVPILLHCLLEQAILNSSCTAESKQIHFQDEKKRVQEYLIEKFVKLGQKLPSSLPYNRIDSQVLLGIEKMDCPLNGLVNATQGFLSRRKSEHKALNDSLIIVHDFDEVGKDVAFFLEGQSTRSQKKTLKHVAEVSKRLAKLMFIPGKCRQGMPKVSLLTREERGTLESKIQSDGQYSLSLVQTNRKLRKLKEFLLMSSSNSTSQVLQLEKSLHSLECCQFMELFPDMSISEVYSKAKLNRPFERLFYDEMEDCLVSVLYATNGEFEWKHSIPCQITFGDFCNKHQDLRSFTVASRSYKLEEHRGQVNDKKYYHLLEGGGLFSFGLPSVLGNVREPQGTLYMDGNTFVMRSVKKESRRDIELTAFFEDGLTACFFVMENGSISLQLSNPNGSTVQMDSHGFIYICSTYMDFQNQMTCQHSGKMDPKQTDGRNSKNVFGDPASFSGRKEMERDCWRCILPSGTVLCNNQNNEELVAMFRNGNVSEYRVVNSQCCQWTTTNSQGYQVVQVPQEKNIEQSHDSQNQTYVDQAEISPKLKAGVEDKKVSSKTSKEAKQIKNDEFAEAMPSKIVSMKKNEVIADAKEKKGQGHENKTPSDVEGTKVNPFGQDLPKIVSDDPLKPCLFLLPRKRVVSIVDLETNCRIESREDLVTVVRTPEGELIAQHSDGTQMYTRASKSQSTSDNTLSICENICGSSVTQNNGLTTVQGSSVLQKNTSETAKVLSMESSASSASIRNWMPNILTQLHDSTVSSGSVDWQIIKEDYPTIWSEGDNIMVDISTQQNKYILSFCKSTGTLHLLLPGGQCMYTSGLSVFLDCSNMRKRVPQSNNSIEEVKDLETWEHSHLGSKKADQDQAQQCQHIQTSGLYTFNLEEGAISHEDPSGDGFYAPQGGDVQRLCGDRVEEAPIADAAISEMLDKSKAPKLPSLGPTPRFFVLHEDGHGYELFGVDAFDCELEKIQKEEHSLHISEAYQTSPSQGSLHTFIRRLCTNSEDFQPSLSCYGKLALETTSQTWPSKKASLEDKPKHCAHMKRAMPMLYSLPQVLLQTPPCKPVSKHKEFFVSYRHIREYPTMDGRQVMEMDQYLEKLREWTVDALISSSMAAADDKLQQGEGVTGVKSEIPQVSATTPRPSVRPENITALDGNEEKIRIAHLIMADLRAHIRQFKAKHEEDEAEREAASNRALSKLSRVVAKNLLEEIMTSCSRRMCNKQDIFLYFSCEEGLHAWLKAQGQQKSDVEVQVLEEIVQGVINMMLDGS